MAEVLEDAEMVLGDPERIRRIPFPAVSETLSKIAIERNSEISQAAHGDHSDHSDHLTSER